MCFCKFRCKEQSLKQHKNFCQTLAREIAKHVVYFLEKFGFFACLGLFQVCLICSACYSLLYKLALQYHLPNILLNCQKFYNAQYIGNLSTVDLPIAIAVAVPLYQTLFWYYAQQCIAILIIKNSLEKSLGLSSVHVYIFC